MYHKKIVHLTTIFHYFPKVFAIVLNNFCKCNDNN